jgi:hypothetical protein
MGRDIEKAGALAQSFGSNAGSRTSSSSSASLSLSATSSNVPGSKSGAGGRAASSSSSIYLEDEHDYADRRARSQTLSNIKAEEDDNSCMVNQDSLNGNPKNGHALRGGSSVSVLHSRQSSFATDATLDTLDDPSTFKLKLRVGLFYLACSTAHELMIYKIAQRTFWQTAAFFLSFEYLLWLVCGVILMIYMRFSKSVPLQKIIGGNGTQLLWPSSSSPSLYKDVLPLAALLVATAALRLFKDGLLDVTSSASISVSCHFQMVLFGTALIARTNHLQICTITLIRLLQSYIAPALLLLIPSMYISTVQATN